MTHAIQSSAGVRLTTQTTNRSTRTLKAPSNARPLCAPSKAAYSGRLNNCAANRNADG
jgi:hypothetical protein